MNIGQLCSVSGGRRFVLTVGGGLFSTALLVAGYLTESGYITLQLATVGAYISSNVIQKYNEVKHNNGEN